MARLRGFWREPGAVLWVYGLPLLLSTGLAIAFRNRPVEQIFVDVQEHPAASETARALEPTPELVVAVHGAAMNAELERQTERDTTAGAERPMGERGAYAADTVGPTRKEL